MRNNNNRNKNHGRRGPRRGGQRGNNEQSLGKQKSSATNQKERYLNMARDALSNGERVDAEYYYQHVEHYSRILNDIADKEAERNATREAQQAERAEEETGETVAEGESDATEQETAEKPKRTRGPRKPRADKKPAEETAEIPLPEGVVPAAAGDEATA